MTVTMTRTMPTVAVLLTCFNRRELTLRALRSLAPAADGRATLNVVLVDDGSTDGTARTIRSEFPSTQIVQGTGDLYWTGGMARAEAAAMQGQPDFLLWLNDDVVLKPGAIANLLDTSAGLSHEAIVVGAVSDQLGRLTYSGYRRLGYSPQNLVHVEPSGTAQQVDTMNGNIVLVPRSAAEQVGGIDSRFTHRFGDIDYGYRARRRGISVVVAPAYAGSCEFNDAPAPHLAPGLSLRERLAVQRGPLVVPIADQARFSRRHAKAAWPAATLSPYVRTIAWHLARRASHQVQRSRSQATTVAS